MTDRLTLAYKFLIGEFGHLDTPGELYLTLG